MIFPHITIYTDRLTSPSAAGQARGPVILIRPRYRGDAGLLRHEYEHVRQFWMTLGLHPILYLLVRRYRAWAEARAFAAQVKPDRSDIDVMAARLARPIYRLGISPAAARAMLLAHLAVAGR